MTADVMILGQILCYACLVIKNKKYGDPIAVTTKPVGIPVPTRIDRAIMSASSIRMAPSSIDNGRLYWCCFPINF